MKRNFFPILADILAVVGFVLALFIACRVFPNQDNTKFDYQAVLVGIIGTIFTLLIGWNIYQAIDWKTEIRKVDKLRKELNRELNYIHNKSDYNQAITYVMMSQTASAHFAPNEDDVLKFQMLKKGIAAIKILSRLPDCELELKSIMETLIKGLENSSNQHLDDNIKTDLLISCGEIENRDSIKSFDKLIELIQNC